MNTKFLSDSEYEKAVINLYSNNSAYPSKEEDENIRYKLLQLKIDNKLGFDFPLNKRLELWNADQRIEKNRLLNIVKNIFGLFIGSYKNQRNMLIDEYSKILTKKELEKFLESNE